MRTHDPRQAAHFRMARFAAPVFTMALLLYACALEREADPPPSIRSNLPTGSGSPEPSPYAVKPAATASPTSDAPPPFGAEREFRTDFSRHSIDYAEVLSGGPPKDGIPAIDQPNFETIAQADDWLEPLEPVILIKSGEDARAYPLQILVWHEIVNDFVNSEPVLITFCPLCNTAIAFARNVNGGVLDFSTTGRLLRPYGQNPYLGYDDINNTPLQYQGPETPDRLVQMARVLALDGELAGERLASVVAVDHFWFSWVAFKPETLVYQP